MPGSLPFLPSRDTIARVGRWLTGTFAGRALIVGLVLKAVAAPLRALAVSEGVADTINTAGGVALVLAMAALVYAVYHEIKGVVLWRVRRKLTLSYIFIGFVPALLLIVLFSISGLLLFYNVSQYSARSGVRSVVSEAAFLAESAAVGLQGSPTESELRDRLTRRQVGAQRSFPFISYAVVPARRPCDAGGSSSQTIAPAEVVTAGPWRHVDPPQEIPQSVTCPEGFAALVAYTNSPLTQLQSGQNDREVAAHLAARAVAWPDEPNPRFAVVVDVPFSREFLDSVHEETGIEIGDVTVSLVGKPCTNPVLDGREIEPPGPADKASGVRNPLRRPLEWVLFLEFTDWQTAGTCSASVRIVMTIADVYARVSEGSGLDVVLFGIGFVGVLLVVIQGAAFIMGLTLARSITGSIHELFTGTERVRLGDFTHKISIHSRDQLGELAESFNSMTSSIEDLLREKAEKERLEQELRIARSIQMSLLPTGPLAAPGLSVTAHCEPAREVGGDYYDYMPIDDHRVGLLIADVAGKGTSAALYMAELKGLMLSLTQLHTSPRRLLIDANRIISRHLDSRSFITITYAVVDLEARTLTYARAGHCPLIYVPGPHAPSRAAQILAPDGLVLGLQIDDGQRFNGLLAEATVPLGAGDLFLFYTDGLTEAMDPDGNIFGEARLAALLQEQADAPFDQLRERILREIEVFSGPTEQQDDMTILLLKVEDVGTSPDRARPRAAAEAELAAAGGRRS
ncbi:MAG TPA: SpoIIE family protein phosphatase [Vicinamibacterales bacterium]|nr:SpoIIE family protein phosphatase [Vicinamibacterales bacterium]